MKKLYRSITEVAELLKEQPSTLRYWESQFKELHPDTNAKGTRHYKQEDIDLLQKIQFLTRTRGYTLEGARNYLHEHRGKKLDVLSLTDRLLALRTQLQAIQKELKYLVND